jgi:hypothetical protein
VGPPELVNQIRANAASALDAYAATALDAYAAPQAVPAGDG